MSMYVPQLYFNIENLAVERNLDYNKLNKGLGLEKMRIPDVHEDAATMAANAVCDLIDKNKLTPDEIGRIYMGTESALDGAKPTATYVLEMLRNKYKAEYGPECFRNCDVVDLTFACVGAVDALHNTLDWVRGNKSRKGIVVASDFAKYELNSGGEYTQGAGAIAMLVEHHPRLIAFEDPVGVATKGVHDFFKPRRSIDKRDFLLELAELGILKDTGIDKILEKLYSSLDVSGVLDSNEEVLEIYKDTPVFDGQYSNWTYQNRIREAYENYCSKKRNDNPNSVDKDYFGTWDRLVFHLPYAFHGKRIASELFLMSMQKQDRWAQISQEVGEEPQRQDFDSDELYESTRSKFLRSITKTAAYKSFVSEKLEKAQRASSLVGNMYACAIFLALMSTLESDLEEGTELAQSAFGFIGYGSGSKSKVFEGTIQEDWKEVVSNFKVFEKLAQGSEINYSQYEKLHRKQIKESLRNPKNEFVLQRIESEGVKLGARYYEWIYS